MTAPASRRLTRDTHNKVLGGVCSGLARYFGMSPSLLRLLFVISCVLPGPQFIAYLVLWLVLPPDTRA
jgi:phage shock protein PspC (stress-responsive transcriptional regulator)